MNECEQCGYEGMPQARVWDAPGRGTAAGRALFRLYNGFATARHKGDEFSLQNRLNILRRLSMGAAAGKSCIKCGYSLCDFSICRAICTHCESKVQPKATVRVPRYRRRMCVEEDGGGMCPVGGGKRKASYILDKLKEDFANMGLPPPSTKPVLDDKEKQRLQTIFEWHGLLDEGDELLLAPKVAAGASKQILKGSKEEKEQLLEMISKEIEEREAFLKDMKKFGKDEMYRSQIQWEIRDRVKQMKQLDKLICLEEEKAKAKRNITAEVDDDTSRKSVHWK